MDRRGFLSVGGLTLAAAAIPATRASALSLLELHPRPTVRVHLDKATYRQGEVMTLTLTETISKRKTTIVDSSGTIWKRRSNHPDRAVFTATAGNKPTNTLTVTVRRVSDGRTFVRKLAYSVIVSTPVGGVGRWPGHTPGKVMLGLSTSDLASSLARTGPVGLHRTYYTWSSDGEDKTITSDHASGRLPWVSFKPPGGVASWSAIAAGAYDADIKARAQRYAGYSDPVISTFHHEPTNDGGNPADWADAYTHIWDLMNAETGMKNVTFAPIMGDWLFNPTNRDGNPTDWLTGPVLDRIPFLGVDLYQNESNDGFDVRLGRILDWLDYNGVDDPMVGVGETGCCLSEDPQPQEWLQANWDWAKANTASFGAMSYFDSIRNSRDGHVWSLDETNAKLATYQGMLASGTAATL